MKCSKKAAERGDVDCMRMTGDCYALGSGVRQDKDEAMRWYRMAAEHGDMDSREMMEEY